MSTHGKTFTAIWAMGKTGADEFFANFVNHLAATGISEGTSVAPSVEAAPTEVAPEPPTKPMASNKSWMVIAGIIIIVLAVLGYLLR